MRICFIDSKTTGVPGSSQQTVYCKSIMTPCGVSTVTVVVVVVAAVVVVVVVVIISVIIIITAL